jgi:hypothetical protein
MSNDQPGNRQDERREFFRIDDSIQISYRVISGDEVQRCREAVVQGKNDSFTIMTRLQAISQNLSASLHRIEQRQPDVADYLKALDEKITLLGQALLAEENDLTTQPRVPVNLSAGGMALDSVEPVQEGTNLEVKLLLLPSYTGIVAVGEVVGLLENREDELYPYHLRINFSDIREQDRDALIRHNLRRQGQLLRRSREQRDLT